MGVVRPSSDRRLALQMAISILHLELGQYDTMLDRPLAQMTATQEERRQQTLARRDEVLGQIHKYKAEVRLIEEGGRLGQWMAVERVEVAFKRGERPWGRGQRRGPMP